MAGVQLIGTKAVMQRYEKLNAEAWALYQGKEFLVGGMGGEDLRDWVHDFEQSGSTATYTLRVYDFEEPPTCKTGTTDYIASVNFKAVDQYDGYGIAGHSNKLMERIKGLEEKLKDHDGDEDEGQDLNSVIMGWLTEPQKLGLVIGAVKQLFGAPSMPMPVPAPVAGAQPQLQTISGFQPGTQPQAMSAEQSLERLSKAIDILEKHDTDLITHLEKLAKLAETDELLFKAIISKLDAL